LGKKITRILDSMGIVLVLSAGALISATLLLADPVGSALCGVEGASVASALHLMPLYLAMLIVGIGNSAQPYVRTLLKRNFSKQDLKRIFLGLVISGGSVYRQDGKYCLRYYGKDAYMHGVFRDLAYQIYGTVPQTLKVESRGTYMSQFYSKAAVLELGEFSPEMTPRKGGVPTISYILEGNRSVKVEAARAIMSNSGWVTCTFSVHEGVTRAYPRLGFGSVLDNHLAMEYVQLMETLPLSMSHYYNVKYPETGYLATTDQSEMQSFLKIGGFLEGSTVKKGAFSGMEKNRLLKALVGSRHEEFGSRKSAIEHLRNRDDKASLELGIYLDRLMLG
jgi:hypothetical protein